MAFDWRPCSLGDALTLQRGFDLPVTQRVNGHIPVIASTGQVGWHNVSPLAGPGVVIGRSGSLGGGQFIEGAYWPLNTTLWVKDFKGNDPLYCYYLLKSIDFRQFNVGSGVPTLNRNHIHPLPIYLPPVEVQQSISALLGALDARIENLRQANATLEAIAQALFKSWFVDFDPVRAKAEGREPEGMNAATAALFPSEFEDSELGPIPKGWTVGRVSEFAEIKGGKQLVREHFDPEGRNPIFGGAGEMGRTNLANADGLVITVGRVGAYCGQFFWHLGPAWVNNNASRISPHGDSGFWVYWSLRNADIGKIKKGAAQPFVSNSDVAALPIIVPPLDLAVAFHSLAMAIHKRMASLVEQACQLAELRDNVLPRLISGRLRLPQAEAAVADAI